MMQREGKTWVLYSSKGHVLGRASNRRKLLKREKQVRFFSNLSRSSGHPGSLLAKVSQPLKRRELRRRRRLRNHA